VPQGTIHGTFAGELVEEVSKAKSGTCCKFCGSERLFRVFREGYLQEKIYPIFGYYPWKCKACKHYMMLRKRKTSRSKAKEYVD
jgi:hypothetical protein